MLLSNFQTYLTIRNQLILEFFGLRVEKVVISRLEGHQNILSGWDKLTSLLVYHAK